MEVSMAFLPVGSFHSFKNKSDSWLRRVSNHLRQALHASGGRPTAANGAPLHFQAIDLSARHGRAQTVSIGLHAAILAVLILALTSSPSRGPLRNFIDLGPTKPLLSYVPPGNAITEQPSLGRAGGGGENDPRPARFGNLAPASSMPLVPPRVRHEENPALPAPPAVLDPNAPASVALVTHLGLPWASGDTNSAGPGKHHGFGSGDRGTMGDGSGNGAGAGDGDLPYANVVSPVTCLYCPQPNYTDEARKAKLEGKILLRVLVDPDGKPQRIQILQGLGMGLDERTEETIRTWRFSPARDANKNPVATWVMIDTRFQLY
jgi:protein TonB